MIGVGPLITGFPRSRDPSAAAEKQGELGLPFLALEVGDGDRSRGCSSLGRESNSANSPTSGKLILPSLPKGHGLWRLDVSQATL